MEGSDDRVRVGNADASPIENGKKVTDVVVEGAASSSKMVKEKELAVEEEEEEVAGEEVPLIGGAECRICQDEDILNNLESPCACSGSLKVKFSVFSSLSSLLVPNLVICKINIWT